MSEWKCLESHNKQGVAFSLLSENDRAEVRAQFLGKYPFRTEDAFKGWLFIRASEFKYPLQDFYIDRDVPADVHPTTVTLARNQIRYECQRDWELLWDKSFIFAGCCGGIESDISRLEKIIKAAEERLRQYREKEKE